MLLDIAKLLLQKNLVNYQTIKNVLEQDDSLTIKSFKDSLINSGLIDKNVLEDQIRKNFGANIEDIKNVKVDEEILGHIRKETAVNHLVLPLRITDSKLVVAMTDPSDLFLLDQLGFESGIGITPVMASKETIRNAVIKNYRIDFNDQNIEIEVLDHTNSTENIINELKEYEKNGPNGHTQESSFTETAEETNEPELQLESAKKADENIENLSRDEISLELETDNSEKPHKPQPNSENKVDSGFAPFKSSSVDRSSENLEIETNIEDQENAFQSTQSQNTHQEIKKDNIVKLDGKAPEKENPFASAISISEEIEELTPVVSEEESVSEEDNKNVEVEALSEEKESLDTAQSSPFASTVSSTSEPDEIDETLEVTEELSPAVHKNEEFHKEEAEYTKVEELKPDESGIDSANMELNPFSSPAKTLQVSEFDEINDNSFVENNPFDTASETELTKKHDEHTEEIQEKEPIEDQIDLTNEEPQKVAPENINILIVDKSVTMQRVMTQALEKIGYKIVNSDNAIDAISKINNSKPDLIVIDIKLPHMDGYQLCKTIKKNADTKDIPIIMLSGKDGIFDKMKGKMAGANAYITKPFKPNRLTSIIEELTTT